VNLAGLQAEGVMFQAAVTDAVGHIVSFWSSSFCLLSLSSLPLGQRVWISMCPFFSLPEAL
jgi:hypothetical protein